MTNTSNELKNKFISLACQLSPENLSCDGELPTAQVRKRYSQLKREWGKLEVELGRTVTENEVWSWSSQS